MEEDGKALTPYATSTRTKRNLAALAEAGWHLLLTPDIHTNPGMPYAVDNGAYGCWLRGEPFNEQAFRRLLQAKGAGADWVVVPDIVAAGDESLAYSLRWLAKCQEHAKRVLLAVQDGMKVEMLKPHLSDRVGLFIGGTTEWKLASMPMWGVLAKQTGCYLHVGRVNTKRRIRWCADVGADSFDGTSATKYAVTLPMLDFERKQAHLPW